MSIKILDPPVRGGALAAFAGSYLALRATHTQTACLTSAIADIFSRRSTCERTSSNLSTMSPNGVNLEPGPYNGEGGKRLLLAPMDETPALREHGASVTHHPLNSSDERKVCST